MSDRATDVSDVTDSDYSDYSHAVNETSNIFCAFVFSSFLFRDGHSLHGIARATVTLCIPYGAFLYIIGNIRSKMPLNSLPKWI